MGFESFRVELRGSRTAQAETGSGVRSLPRSAPVPVVSITQSEAAELVLRLPGARPDARTGFLPGAMYFAVEDGRHIVEVEVSADLVRVSCRFTLCHPPSVDTYFLGLVERLLAVPGMEVWIPDDVPPADAGWFAAARFAQFEQAALRRIAARRSEWAAEFGPGTFAAGTAEAYRKVILPRCEPIVR